MKLGNILGCLIVMLAVAATTFAGDSVHVPEPDPATLTTVGLVVGGYLYRVFKYRNKK